MELDLGFSYPNSQNQVAELELEPRAAHFQVGVQSLCRWGPPLEGWLKGSFLNVILLLKRKKSIHKKEKGKK